MIHYARRIVPYAPAARGVLNPLLKNLLSGFFPVIRSLLLLFAGAARLCAGNLESDSIAEMSASHDGRYLAMAGESGEMGVLDLEGSGTLPIFTHHYFMGMSWAEGSRRLVFSEKPPGAAPRLMIVRPMQEKEAGILLEGPDWKAQPGWLSESKILFRSNRNSDHVNLWAMDLHTSETALFLDSGKDISNLWTSPAPGAFIYSTVEGGASELWCSPGPGQERFRITQDAPHLPIFEDGVVFSPQGGFAAFIAYGQGPTEIVQYNLDLRARVAALPVKVRPRSLMVLSGDEIVVNSGSRIFRWLPRRKWRESVSEAWDWNGVPLQLPVMLRSDKVAAVVNENLIVTAGKVAGLKDGKLHTRRMEDLLDLSVSLQVHGNSKAAASLLDRVWNEYKSNPGSVRIITATRAWLEQARTRPGFWFSPSTVWLDKLISLAGPESPEYLPAVRARLLLAIFEEKNIPLARQMIKGLSESATSHPLIRWTRELMDGDEPRNIEEWRRFIRDLERRRWPEAAEAMLDMISDNSRTRIHRQGVALLLRGDFEPLAYPLGGEQARYSALLNEIPFQQAMLQLAGGDLSPEFTKDDFRDYLLLQWGKSGQIEAARNLALLDLTDPTGSSLDYADILARHLLAEEQEAWVERAVAEVLLFPRVTYLLNRDMSDAKGHLILLLARSKNALIQNDLKSLQQILDQIDADIALIPVDFWDAQTGRLLYLVRLYRTKLYERRGRWDAAQSAYDRAHRTLERFPADWEITAFDLMASRALIETGKANPDLLKLYLATIRGLGDPLINPVHEVDAVGVGMTNLRTLLSRAGESWLLPFLHYSLGSCLDLLNHPYEAIAALREARALNPPQGLLERILLEEAAARSTLRQYGLASDLLKELCGLKLSQPQLAVAIKARAQAEKEAGSPLAQEELIHALGLELGLAPAWIAMLTGADDAGPLIEVESP